MGRLGVVLPGLDLSPQSPLMQRRRPAAEAVCYPADAFTGAVTRVVPIQ